MMEQAITIEAHSLAEARELVKEQVPRGLIVLAERVAAEGAATADRAAAGCKCPCLSKTRTMKR
jgi:hypothetical protein